jgi:hypothetical protein
MPIALATPCRSRTPIFSKALRSSSIGSDSRRAIADLARHYDRLAERADERLRRFRQAESAGNFWPAAFRNRAPSHIREK